MRVSIGGGPQEEGWDGFLKEVLKTHQIHFYKHKQMC